MYIVNLVGEVADAFSDTLLDQLGIREGIRDFSNQIDRELKQDDSRFKAAPATVTVTPIVK